MSKTRLDIIVEALNKLGVSQDGQDPSAGDKAIVETYYNPMLDMLQRERVVYLGDRDAVDDVYFIPLATMLANAAANNYGGAYDEKVDFREKARLRVLQPRPGGFDAMRVDYF